MKIKNVFKIEYLLISLSLVIFAFTVFLKIESQKKYDELNSLINNIMSNIVYGGDCLKTKEFTENK